MTRAQLEITGAVLVRNGLLNIAGQGMPFLIGLVSVPVTVHGLGTERFGLLVFTWTLLGVLGISDLGLGSAVTKYVAEALGGGSPKSIPGVFWAAVLAQAVLGGVAALFLVVGAAPLVQRVLTVTPALHLEAVGAFRIVAITLPVLLVSTSFRGALEAAQRFDVAAAWKAASGTATFLVPMVGSMAGMDLPGIMAMLLAVRLLLLGLLVWSTVRVIPVTPVRGAGDPAVLRRLAAFGGWMTVSALAGLLLVYADRFVIGGRLPLAALTYYSVPQEMVARLTVISASVVAVLFPAFSALGGAKDRMRLRWLFGRSTKYVVLIAVPVFGLIAVVAPDILRLWLGPDLAGHSAAVLRVLAIGAGVQALAVVPYTLLQGLGRPDLTAKIHLMEAPVYLAALVGLVNAAGIVGAAAAWSGRMVVEGVLLFWVAGRANAWPGRMPRDGRRTAAGTAALCGASALVYLLPIPLAPRAALLIVAVTVFGLWAWSRALDADERRGIVRMVASGRPALPRVR